MDKEFCPNCQHELPPREPVFEIVDSPLGVAPAPEAAVMFRRFKLRRKSDGLFSTGGTSVRWTDKGKEWNTLAALSGHLSQHRGVRYGAGYYSPSSGVPWDDLEIVTVEGRVNEAATQEAAAYVAGMRERAAKRKVQEETRTAKRKVAAAQRDLEAAQRRFEQMNAQWGM